MYLYDFPRILSDFNISSFACLFYLYTIFFCIAHSKDNPMSKHNLYYYRCAAKQFQFNFFFLLILILVIHICSVLRLEFCFQCILLLLFFCRWVMSRCGNVLQMIKFWCILQAYNCTVLTNNDGIMSFFCRIHSFAHCKSKVSYQETNEYALTLKIDYMCKWHCKQMKCAENIEFIQFLRRIISEWIEWLDECDNMKSSMSHQKDICIFFFSIHVTN